MAIPVRIVARGLELGEPDREEIRVRIEKLETFFDRVLGARVTVTVPNRWPQGGAIGYRVRIVLAVPGDRLVIESQPGGNLLDVLQGAVRVAGRRLQDFAARLPSTGPVQAPLRSGHARVCRLFPWEEYGFLENSDGREVYFHRKSVLRGAFDRLEVGAEVRFTEEEGDQGPQASSVSLIGRRRRKRPAASTGRSPETGD